MAKVENLTDRFENSWQYVLAELERIDLLGTRLPMLASSVPTMGSLAAYISEERFKSI